MDVEKKNLLERKVWQLRKNKQYEKAIEIYTQLFNEEPSPYHLFNRATAYLEMRNYSLALEDFKQVMTIQPPKLLSDSYYIFKGICYWHLGQMSLAVESWKQGLTTPYTDAAGGVQLPALLLYAAERLHSAELRKEALQLLRKHARRKLREWPGVIVPFLLEKIDVIELTEKAKEGDNKILTNRWQCQADFYIALRALRQGDWMTFRVKIIQATENPEGFLEPEYYLACWELEHDFPSAAIVREEVNSSRSD